LEIQFLGGASEVGRSAILLDGSKRIMLDHGVKLDHKTQYPARTEPVDACVLSHAHLDHSGNVPFLYRGAFPVTYGTEPTRELSTLLIEDSLKIGRKEHLPPRFSKHDLNNMLTHYAPYEYGSEIDLGEYTVTLHDAGHISGSAITELRSGKSGKTIVYTGDFKLEPQLLHEGAEIVRSDVLITETTYAGREHPDRGELIGRFVDEVKQTLDAGGIALVPSFAVGRAQELLAILHRAGLSDFVFMDGMARKATEIVMRYGSFIRNSGLLRDALDRITVVGSGEHRHDAVSGPSIILTTAGMLNGGPVLNYLTQLNPLSKIFLTGYQVEGTNGRKLMEGKPISLDGRKERIRTPWVYYDFSAHSGSRDLNEYIRKSNPEVVVCVHGEKLSAEAFAEQLKADGFKTHVPRLGESLRLDV
jgi:putative mRNA 3-end processing factor